MVEVEVEVLIEVVIEVEVELEVAAAVGVEIFAILVEEVGVVEACVEGHSSHS